MRFWIFLTFFTPISLVSCQSNPPVIVSTSRGQVIGYHFDQGNDTSQLFYGQGDIFLGIPFAQQPVGNLRYAVLFYSKK